MRYLALIAFLAIAQVGCAGKEILQQRSAAAPGGMDLSGRWTLREDSRGTNRRLDEAEHAAAGGSDSIFETERDSRSRRRRASLVHVFLESGRDLKITQTDDGLFISFDRAIVEEYRFGEYRSVRVGPVEADRSSGWEQGAYVIETLDDKGSKLYERYQLENSGHLLERQITIFRKGEVELSLVQKFDRVDS